MKKLMSILLVSAMIFSFSLTAFAYDTDVVYESAEINMEIDVDGDGKTDGTITDETPYLLVVPEELTVDGAKDTVYISGIVDTAVTVTVPSEVEMSDDTVNKLAADIAMDSGNLVLPISLTDVGNANTGISATWSEAPLAGSWTGNFAYSVQ